MWKGHSRRARVGAITTGAVGVVVVVAVVLGTSVFANASSSMPPFTDPAARGYIGLCNPQGRQMTSGSINSTPFAWRAVSSVAAIAPYNNTWRTATLFAFQPQSGLDPGEWSGQALTASARYTDAAHPMAAATDADDSLADFIASYRPVWDGWLQLRIYLGTQGAEQYSAHYPVLDIHVQGSHWTAVGGGPVSCQSGTSTSIESILPTTTTTQPAHS